MADVRNEEKVLTNREYFVKFCYNTDLCRINRMWLKHLDSIDKREAPLWEKEKEYENWLNMNFDRNEWISARLKKESRTSGMLYSELQLRMMKGF